MSAPNTATLAAHLIANASANPDSAALLAGMMLDRLRYPADGGAPSVVDRDGRPALDAGGSPVTPAALISAFAREMPMLFKPPASPMQVQTTTGRLGMTGTTAKAAAEHAAAQARQSTGERANPYATATRNLTLQVLMEKNNPELAAKMKAAARV